MASRLPSPEDNVFECANKRLHESLVEPVDIFRLRPVEVLAARALQGAEFESPRPRATPREAERQFRIIAKVMQRTDRMGQDLSIGHQDGRPLP
jgi:hypothetical protein